MPPWPATLFGYEVEECRNSRTGEVDAVYRVRQDAKPPAWVRVPNFSRSFSAATLVSLELLRHGWTPQDRQSGTHWNEPSVVRVVLKHADGRMVEAVGDPDEALCRAAVKAMPLAS